MESECMHTASSHTPTNHHCTTSLVVTCMAAIEAPPYRPRLAAGVLIAPPPMHPHSHGTSIWQAATPQAHMRRVRCTTRQPMDVRLHPSAPVLSCGRAAVPKSPLLRLTLPRVQSPPPPSIPPCQPTAAHVHAVRTTHRCVGVLIMHAGCVAADCCSAHSAVQGKTPAASSGY